jgi:hypothetical protein
MRQSLTRQLMGLNMKPMRAHDLQELCLPSHFLAVLRIASVSARLKVEACGTK